jgi:hypothetical protein
MVNILFHYFYSCFIFQLLRENPTSSNEVERFLFFLFSKVIDNNNELNMIYLPTDIIGAFRYVINKKRNHQSTHAIKIQAGLTIQIEKHSKTL